MTLKKPITIHDIRAPGVIGAVKNKKLFDKLYPLAVNMRREPTDAERILWQALRAKKLGVKFRR
jgi:very-short-patch-repair endonuclease